ncbi:hypothetical protein BDW67DRAFT_170163 [Aspergillus spinulosporus]
MLTRLWLWTLWALSRLWRWNSTLRSDARIALSVLGGAQDSISIRLVNCVGRSDGRFIKPCIRLGGGYSGLGNPESLEKSEQ